MPGFSNFYGIWWLLLFLPLKLNGSHSWCSGIYSHYHWYLFIQFMGFARQESWSGLPFLPPTDHILSELSTSPQFPKGAILKNVQTTGQLHSLPMLVRLCSKSFKLGFSSAWIENFQMYKVGLEKAEEPKIKLPIFARSYRKQGNSRKTSTSVSLTMRKTLTVWITTNCGN